MVRSKQAGDGPDTIELRTRTATIPDASAIAAIYNEGIADRIATFETAPRSASWQSSPIVRPTAVPGDVAARQG